MENQKKTKQNKFEVKQERKKKNLFWSRIIPILYFDGKCPPEVYANTFFLP